MNNTAITIIEPSELSNRLQDNPAVVYIASLTSPLSQRTMRQALDTIADIVSNGQCTALMFQWGSLRYQHTQAIRAALSGRYKAATANKMLSALRGVLSKAYKLGLISPDDYAKASDIESVKGSSGDILAGREITLKEISVLVGACKTDTSVSGARDAAIIALAFGCGLRRAELVALELADYDSSNGKILIRMGKGRKARTVYAKNGVSAAVQAWINKRGIEPGALFTRIDKGSKLTLNKLTTQAIYVIFKKRYLETGVKHFSPHDMRRTFAGNALESGIDIATVAKLMGHASVTTTARYDRRNEETKERAAEIVHFPY